jgi:hypothetical protein
MRASGSRHGWQGGAALALALVLGAPAAAQIGPMPATVDPRDAVVIELFTAQGCAACPPADRMLAEMARRPEVIALALHVDYWDYIGWADSFADPEHAERQKRYARSRGLGTIYTPQVVVMGVELLEGFRVGDVQAAVAAHLAAPREARLTLTRGADGLLHVSGMPVEPPVVIASRSAGLTLGAATALAAPPPDEAHDVQLVRYRPHAQVEITAGENAGLQADYVNIVVSWQSVASWDLTGPLELSLPVTGEEPIVVLVQEPRQGAIVAAARLE